MTHYDVLGIDRSSPPSEIRRRYRELARVTHPDRGGDRFQFQVLSEAFAVLDDPARRAAYDRSLDTDAGGPSRPQETNQPAAEDDRPTAGLGDTGRWLADGCAFELAGWLVSIPVVVVIAVGAGVTGRSFDQISLIVLGAAVVVALVVATVRWLASSTRPPTGSS